MNDKLIDKFEQLVKQIEMDILLSNDKDKLKHSFRLKHIKHTLDTIKSFPTKIKNGNDLKHIKGIGIGSIKRIDEIIKSGTLKEILFDDKTNELLKTIKLFKKIYNIGEKTAYKLINKFKIKTIDDLHEKIKSKIIKLPTNIMIGLKYFDKYKENIPREEMLKHEIYLKNVLFDLDKNCFGILCGSYRRKQLSSNDIDFLFIHNKLKTKTDIENSTLLNDFVNKLIKSNYILDSLTSPTSITTKYMGFCKLIDFIRRIDIRFMPVNSYFFALLYMTGAGNFNRKMRIVAKSLGYKLNEYGLYKNGKSIIITSEKDIFDKLNMDYIEPEFRI